MALKWEPHPILKPPSDEEMAALEPSELVKLWKIYHEAIANARKDPFRYGWVLDHWRKAEEMLARRKTLLLLGANRSGKTTYGARAVVKAAVENEGALIFCFSQNQETSVLVQQSAVYEYLPLELKKKATESTHYISYSMQNGFAGNGLVFPNKSRIVFKTYSQYQQNQTILEGMELGSLSCQWLNVGAWCDEYLLGMELLDRLYIRLSTRASKLLLTFTPKDGVTETVRYYLEGAKTIESREAELLGNRTVPYVQENNAKNTGIVYFHSKDNPWSGYESIAEQCRAKGDESYTLTAAYGVPTKTYTTKFPNFSIEVNVVPHDKIDLRGKTKYMVLDPAGRKNWFMVWIAVDETGTWWVYREWPDGSYGDWAEMRGGKWQAGAAAKGLGYGIRDYVDLIGRLEDGTTDTIFERLIDPRLGAQRYQTQTGASSIIEDLDDAGLVFVPAPGLDIEDGLQALQTKMAYNKKSPMDSINRPHFYISDRCTNIISALQEYTADGGLDEAWKDPVDVLRYAAIADIRHINPNDMKVKRSATQAY
jgi:hypothetical protein